MFHNYDPQSFFDRPKNMSRETYEAACESSGATAKHDAVIARAAYELKNREFGGYFAEWLSFDREWRAQFLLDKARMYGLKNEFIPTKRTPRPETMCDCGHWEYTNMVMTASRGTSCTECYDRMSQ